MGANERSGETDSRRDGRHEDDMRCRCGKLLAKKTEDGLVIRCPRCKREMIIDLADLLVDIDTGRSEVVLKEKNR